MTIYRYLKKYTNRLQACLCLFLLLIMMVYNNLYAYFVIYPRTLPYGNIPFGKIIASYLRSLPSKKIYITGYNWPYWDVRGIEPIRYALADNDIVNRTSPYIIFDCSELPPSGWVVVFNIAEQKILKKFKTCFSDDIFKNHYVNGEIIFVTAAK